MKDAPSQELRESTNGYTDLDEVMLEDGLVPSSLLAGSPRRHPSEMEILFVEENHECDALPHHSDFHDAVEAVLDANRIGPKGAVRSSVLYITDQSFKKTVGCEHLSIDVVSGCGRKIACTCDEARDMSEENDPVESRINLGQVVKALRKIEPSALLRSSVQ
jgi:hypothetical protein